MATACRQTSANPPTACPNSAFKPPAARRDAACTHVHLAPPYRVARFDRGDEQPPDSLGGPVFPLVEERRPLGGDEELPLGLRGALRANGVKGLRRRIDVQTMILIRWWPLSSGSPYGTCLKCVVSTGCCPACQKRTFPPAMHASCKGPIIQGNDRAPTDVQIVSPDPASCKTHSSTSTTFSINRSSSASVSRAFSAGYMPSFPCGRSELRSGNSSSPPTSSTNVRNRAHPAMLPTYSERYSPPSCSQQESAQ